LIWFAILMLTAMGVVLTASIWLLSRVLLQPPRMTDAKALRFLGRLTPEDLGLSYERGSFDVSDPGGKRFKIASWWIPAREASDRTVMLIHGYADAKVGAIAWAPMLVELGFNVLAIDLRAHGESEGRFSTGGVREADDVAQILDTLHARTPRQTIHLMGVSLGAAVCAKVASGRDDIATLVLECPYDDFRNAIDRHARHLAAPLPGLSRVIARVSEWTAGVNFDDAMPERWLPRVKCPVLMIHGKLDPFVDSAMVERLAATLKPTDVHVIVETGGHVDAMVVDPTVYRERLASFLSR
jgi:pimeloyl-ACP methyl ester carboxylesterase